MFTPIDKNLLIAAMESAIYHACVNANVMSLHAIETGVSSLRQRFDLDADSVSDADIFSLVDTIERAKIPAISTISALDNDTNIADRVVSFLWKNILEKPTTFPPAEHAHAWNEISFRPATFPPAEHTHTDAMADWNTLQNKPTTFPPATHTHEAQAVAVAWTDVTDKPTTFPPATHTHEAQAVAWSEVTEKPTTFPPAEHTHDAQAVAWSEVTDKPTTFSPHMAILTYIGNNTSSRTIAHTGDFCARFIYHFRIGTGSQIVASVANSAMNSFVLTGTLSADFNWNGYTYTVIVWG